MTASADVATALQAKFPNITVRPSVDHPAFNVSAGEIVSVLQYIKEEQGGDMLSDVTAVDWGVEASPRFSVVWHVLSTATGNYVRLVSDCASNTEPTMPTVSHLWPAANWHERETYDLMGITFTGHPDLRRILMWDGYPHHPLRKDFPLAGIDSPLPDLEVAAETGVTAAPVPMAGGPFVASSGGINLTETEPRAKDESWNEHKPKPSQG